MKTNFRTGSDQMPSAIAQEVGQRFGERGPKRGVVRLFVGVMAGVIGGVMGVGGLLGCSPLQEGGSAGLVEGGDVRGEVVGVDDASVWSVVPSQGNTGKVNEFGGGEAGGGLAFDFEFTRGAGYVIARRAWPRDVLGGAEAAELPADGSYQIELRVRAGGTQDFVQTLEVKLLDESGLNVWWRNIREQRFGREATTIRIPARQISFAWGPSGGKDRLSRIGTLELAITSLNGGSGRVIVEDVRIVRIDPTPLVDLTKEEYSFEDGQRVVLGQRRRVGAMTILGSGLKGGVSEVGQGLEYSVDGGKSWVDLQARGRAAGAYVVFEPLIVTDAVQVRRKRSVGGEEGGVGAIVLHGEGFAENPTQHWREIAAVVGKGGSEKWGGMLPREWMTGRQTFWTVVGGPDVGGGGGNAHEGLINEDGRVELHRAGPSLEPMLRVGGKGEGVLNGGGKWLTWRDGVHSQELVDGFIPIPTVRRVMNGLTLEVTALATDGHGLTNAGVESGPLFVRYRLVNTSASKQAGEFALLLRPLQVNAPWQFLNVIGGPAVVREVVKSGQTGLKWRTADGAGGKEVWHGLEARAGVGAGIGGDSGAGLLRVLHANEGGFDGVDIGMEYLIDSKVVGRNSGGGHGVGGGGGGGVLEFGFSLEGGQSTEWVVSTDMGGLGVGDMAADSVKFEQLLAQTSAAWRERLTRVQFFVPGVVRGAEALGSVTGQELVSTLRSNLAYILINRDGAGFQPGSRSYERSWIRDGSMTSHALLEFGLEDEVRRFIEWYAPFQFASGAVPCVVDRRGPDPVDEHDSHGQLIWIIAEYVRFTGDVAFGKKWFGVVAKAADHMIELRGRRLTAEFVSGDGVRQEPGKASVPTRAFAGLMPESISHEGYSAKPMHSHWDNFFAIRGLRDAAYLAGVAGDVARAQRYASEARAMTKSVRESIEISSKAHGISYVPGCVELGDFDATSTTVALSPCDAIDATPEGSVRRTFERYVQFFVDRMKAEPSTWKDYTPYEWRNVGALVMLGKRDEAWMVTQWLMADRLPKGWNHFGEIVHSDRGKGAWIGDMPHTWVGSDFVRAVRTMFVYERESDGSVVLFAGVPREWIEALSGSEKIGFVGLHTRYGRVDAAIVRGEGGRLEVEVASERVPPGGFVVRLPGAGLGDELGDERRVEVGRTVVGQ